MKLSKVTNSSAIKVNSHLLIVEYDYFKGAIFKAIDHIIDVENGFYSYSYGDGVRSQKISSLLKNKKVDIFIVGEDFKNRFNEKKCQSSGVELSNILNEVYDGFPDCAYGPMRRSIFRSIESKLCWMKLLEQYVSSRLCIEAKKDYREFFSNLSTK